MANLTVPSTAPVLRQDSSRYPTVVAIVPAHNEEKFVLKSLRSLLEQKIATPTKVIFIADNCTDSTFELASSLQCEFPALEVIKSCGNQTGKSGAMNQGFRHLINNPKTDYVVQMDADTILDEYALFRAVEQLESDSSLGGVCARFRILPASTGAGYAERLLWKFQNLEYGLRDAAVIQSFGKDTSLLSGRASVFRYSALSNLFEKRGGVWDENCEVEDHELTLALKKRGWKSAVCMRMLAATLVPDSIGSLTRQRIRWYRGTVRLLKQERFSKHSRKDSLTLLSLLFWLPLRVSFLAWLVLLFAGIGDYQFNLIFTVVAIVLWLVQMAKLQYVHGIDKWQVTIAATIVPYELYSTIRDLVLFVSGVLGILPSRRDRRTSGFFYTLPEE